MMVVSFLFFLALFTGVGLASARKSRGTKADYYVASGSIRAWLVGLSAVATNNSGYMFIGVIGYTYSAGLPAAWLMLGWIAGDFCASHFTHRRLRERVSQTGAVSYPRLLSHWHGQSHLSLQRLIAVISLVFLLTYASAQLVAGGKALTVLLDWPIWSGAVLGAILVGAYSFAGGIRASIWTDAVQSIVMFVAMAVLLGTAVSSLGGWQSTVSALSSTDGLMDPVPENSPLEGIDAIFIFMLGWFFAGASVIGQPHVMVRFFTLDQANHMGRARAWYYLWFSSFYAMATSVGLLARVLITDTGTFDPELALPTLSQTLLPPFWLGLILAGIFSATLSTADSLILSCSSALAHDLRSRPLEQVQHIKWVTATVITASLLLALLNNDSVFRLVIFSWSGLASAFAPLLLFQLAGYQPRQRAAIAAMLSGLIAALIWRLLGWHDILYEGLPGMLMGLTILALCQWIHSVGQGETVAR